MQPLEGIRVIDLAPLGPGPHCSQIMADLGAEIIKVEQPDPKEGPKAGKLLRIPLTSALRRDSKSIFLNLKSDDGREVFYKLVKTADAVIEGYRPGVAKRLQVDYESRARPQARHHLRRADRLRAGRPVRAVRRSRHQLPGGVRHPLDAGARATARPPSPAPSPATTRAAA